MAEECCATGGNIMILACSGGSNVGQLANQAAVELTQEGFGKMYCLAGVGGHLSGFVQSAKDVRAMVTIDGCRVGCGKALLEHAAVPLRRYLVVTDLGIEKNKEFTLSRDQVARVKSAIKGACAEIMPDGVCNAAGSPACCGWKCSS